MLERVDELPFVDIYNYMNYMIQVDRELVRVQGKECITPLHCAAEEGNVELMVEFLLACPESILDVN